jgi:hypothetical protein
MEPVGNPVNPVPSGPPPADPVELARSQSRLRRVGGCVLVVGLILAAWFQYRVKVDDRSAAMIAAARNTKTYEYQMEVYGGKANLLATEVHDSLAGLFQGRQLPVTVAVLSVIVAVMLFAAARYLPHLPAEDEHPGAPTSPHAPSHDDPPDA